MNRGKTTYTGTNWKAVACRCGARLAIRNEWTKSVPGPDVLYSAEGVQVKACPACGATKFLPEQQIHPGGKLDSGAECPCARHCRSWKWIG